MVGRLELVDLRMLWRVITTEILKPSNPAAWRCSIACTAVANEPSPNMIVGVGVGAVDRDCTST